MAQGLICTSNVFRQFSSTSIQFRPILVMFSLPQWVVVYGITDLTAHKT